MRAFKKAMKKVYGWIAAGFLLPWRYTMRYRVVGELPRGQDGKGFAVAFLHAHQLPGLFAVRLHNPWVMVSRSADGDMLVPTLAMRGIRVARGSSRKGHKEKGGRDALSVLAQQVRLGDAAFLAVDGPQGPRGKSKRGIAALAIETEVPIYPAMILPARRWILKKAWDRMQLPKPFTTITFYWGEPILPGERSSVELRQAVDQALETMERELDPEEAAVCDKLRS